MEHLETGDLTFDHNEVPLPFCWRSFLQLQVEITSYLFKNLEYSNVSSTLD